MLLLTLLEMMQLQFRNFYFAQMTTTEFMRMNRSQVIRTTIRLIDLELKYAKDKSAINALKGFKKEYKAFFKKELSD